MLDKYHNHKVYRVQYKSDRADRYIYTNNIESILSKQNLGNLKTIKAYHIHPARNLVNSDKEILKLFFANGAYFLAEEMIDICKVITQLSKEEVGHFNSSEVEVISDWVEIQTIPETINTRREERNVSNS